VQYTGKALYSTTADPGDPTITQKMKDKARELGMADETLGISVAEYDQRFFGGEHTRYTGFAC
jgi:hypothetical protein